MNISLMIWLSGILVTIAAIVTVLVLKQEERKSKKYAGARESGKAALQRSQEYERDSVSSMIPVQLWSYSIVTVLSLIIILYFAMK